MLCKNSNGCVNVLYYSQSAILKRTEIAYIVGDELLKKLLYNAVDSVDSATVVQSFANFWMNVTSEPLDIEA